MELEDKNTDSFKSPTSASGMIEFIALMSGLLVLYFLCLHPSLKLFLYGDDFCFIWKSLRTMETGPLEFLNPAMYNDFFRPIAFISFYLLHHFFGLQPVYFHSVLIVLHLFSTLLLWRLIHITAPGERPVSRLLAVGLAWYFFSQFRIHQAIYWSSGIKEVLSVLFGFMAMAAFFRWVRGGPRTWFVAAMILMVIGLCTVESFLGFGLAFIAFILFWPGRKTSLPRPKTYALVPALIVLFYLISFAVSRAVIDEGRQYDVLWKPLSYYPGHVGLFIFRSMFRTFLIRGTFCGWTGRSFPLVRSGSCFFRQSLHCLSGKTGPGARSFSGSISC